VLGLQCRFDVIDGEILLAHRQDEFADGVLLGLGMRATLELTEEVGLGAWGVAKAAGDLSRGKALDEVGAESLVLALSGRGGDEEEAGLCG
jgi:hypothetical protein